MSSKYMAQGKQKQAMIQETWVLASALPFQFLSFVLRKHGAGPSPPHLPQLAGQSRGG